ncbi:MAG: hypothetical protein Q7R35_18420 [Elusimicrobiota bacterium]|nr:hypothetical protein [Elusimicrobiota bacterium]
MKKITLKILALAAVLSCGGKAAASEFNLQLLNVADMRAGQADFRAPAPRLEADELMGMDMNIRVPFKMIKNSVAQMTATEKRLTIIDMTAPVVFRSGEFLKISNIRVDANGIIVIPTLTLKPYLEGRDKLAIRIQRVQLHASMEPSVKAAPAAAISDEQLMVQVMDVMIKGIYSALDAKLKAKNLPLKAQDVVKLNYDKTAWTLHAAISSKIISQFIPAGLVGELHLTGFSLSDTGISLKIQTAE